MRTEVQLPLLFPMARGRDPETSHVAAKEHARSGRASERRGQILALVAKYPGRTSGELSLLAFAEKIFPSIRVCAETPHKRLPELEKLWLVRRGTERRCSDSGQLAATWWAT